MLDYIIPLIKSFFFPLREYFYLVFCLGFLSWIPFFVRSWFR